MVGIKKTCAVLARAAVLTAALAVMVHPMRAAAETMALRVKETLEVDGKGDLKVRMDVKMPAGQYTQVKGNNPNLAAYLRNSWKQQPDWLEVRDFTGSYDDGASTIHLQWAARGAVRSAGDDRWEVPLFGGDDADLISTEGATAILSRVADTKSGQASVTTRVVVPAGAKDIRLAHGPARLTFQAPMAAENGDAGTPEFTLDAKTQVMSCLAKAIGNPRFSDLWVARATFNNTGGKAVADYRVRFRVNGYTQNWSDWKVSPKVAAGQTVVDAYFPLFDLSKLSVLEGPQQSDLEVEYEYARGEEKVHKVETRRLKLLDRTQALSGGLSEDEIIGWHDRMNYMPYVLSAFVTHDDPVIQQTAGWVSGRAGGAASAFSDDEAMKFMGALYNFMEVNKVAYQSPPFATSEGEFFQHIKYGRDVLKNKAGTCIDLAIFFASVSDAVGLEPLMVSTQLPEGGHCFPVIRLPVSGRLVAVETTMIGHGDFQAALKKGEETYGKVLSSCPYYQVSVRILQDRGCSCIELPKLPGTALKDWGIVNPATVAKEEPKPAPKPAPNTDTDEPRPTPRPTPNTDTDDDNDNDQRVAGKLPGQWEADVNINGDHVHQIVRFTADGGMVTNMETDDGRSATVKFRYTYTNGTLSLLKGGQVVETGKIVWQNADKLVYQTQTGRVVYTRTAN